MKGIKLSRRRFIVGACLLIVAFGCAGLVEITMSFGASLSDLLAADSPAQPLTTVILISCATAAGLAGLLFSSVPLGKAHRLCLLALTTVVALASLAYAQLVFVFWLIPLFQFWRFYREAAP